MPTNVISVSDLILDNSIQQDTTTTSNYFADNGIIRADFIQSGNTVKYTSKGRMITWVPQNMRYVDALGMEDTIYSAQDVPLETKANYVRFNRTMPDIDDWFIVENDQVKHQILVQGFQRDPMPYLSDPIQFAVGGQLLFDADLTVRSMGMTLTGAFQTADAIQICNGEELIFTLPQVVAYDSKIPERAQTTGFYNVTTNSAGNLQFDIVIDNAWVSDVARVYPLVIDPTVIVSSAYDTSGNGGRKMVKLPGGRQINIAVNTSTTTIYAFKSDDNGTTWAQLCTISGAQAGAAIANVGNNCTVLLNNTTTAYSVTFDGTAVTNIDLNSTKKTVDTQTSISNNVSIISDVNGKLWASLSSKNTTYPNSNNFRVSSSNDGGTTWATPTQIGGINTSGTDLTNPCLVVKSNNNPVIIGQYASSSTNTIMTWVWSGTAWQGSNTAYAGGTYLQLKPCAAVDGNDVIDVTWQGADSTNTAQNIRHAKSSDGGLTFSSATLLTTASTNQINPTITIDPNNNLYVLFTGVDTAVNPTYVQLRKIVYSGGIWGSVTTLTSETSGGIVNPQTLWSKYNMNSADAIRYMYQDMQASSVKYDSISLNAPPNAPTLTAHANFDATVAQALAWLFSDPDSGNTQSAYQLQVYDPSTSTTVIDTGKVASTVSSYALAANALAQGKQYQWRVLTYDNSGAVGPYSAYSTFYTAAAPTVTITAPTANQVVTTSSLTVGFSYSDPANNAQQSYEVLLYDSTGNTILNDSGVISGTNNQYTIPYTLANATSYKVKVIATNSKGVAGTSTVVTFSVSFTPPATATIAVTSNSAGAYNTVVVTNPAPSGSQPTVSSNDLYRKPTASTVAPIRIATGIANNGTHNDYTAPSGVSHDYYVQTNGSNGTTSQSATASQTVTLAGVWLHDVTDPTGTALNVRINTPRSEQWTPDSTPMKFAGRTRPVVAFGEHDDYKYHVSLKMTTAQAIWPALSSLARRKAILCVRDSRGRKMFAIIAALPETDEFYGESVDIEFTEVSYTEVV